MREEIKELLNNCTGFDWDKGNRTKNWFKHRVSISECEQVFFNRPLIVNDDVKHSKNENRFYVLGQTDFGRKLFLVFTVRDNKIRIISARDMNKKERKIYKDLQ